MTLLSDYLEPFSSWYFCVTWLIWRNTSFDLVDFMWNDPWRAARLFFLKRNVLWTFFRCRYCNYAVIVEVAKDVDKVFRCNHCLSEICRICGKDWDEKHIGIPCQELKENTQDTFRRELWVCCVIVRTVLTEFGSFHMKSTRSKPQGCSCWISHITP